MPQRQKRLSLEFAGDCQHFATHVFVRHVLLSSFFYGSDSHFVLFLGFRLRNRIQPHNSSLRPIILGHFEHQMISALLQCYLDCVWLRCNASHNIVLMDELSIEPGFDSIITVDFK